MLLDESRDFLGYVNDNLSPKIYRSTGWTTPGVSERDMTRYNREEAMAKARELVETYPIVAGIVQTLADNIIGSGFTLDMQSRDEAWDLEVENWWSSDSDALDIRGMRTVGQLQRLWFSRRFIDGDVGIHVFEPQLKEPLFIQTLEADRIRFKKYDYLDTNTSPWKSTEKNTGIFVQQGIAYDKYGKMVGAFAGPRPKNQLDWDAILKDGSWLSANDFMLYAHFHGERADSLRGVSAMLQNFNIFRDIAEIMNAVLQKIKNEAFIALQLIKDASYAGNISGDHDTTKEEKNGKKRKVIPLKPGMTITPPPGEKAELLGLKTPNQELMPYIRFVLRYSGTAFGLPLEMLLMDMSETNWSGGRVVLELAKRRFRVEQNAQKRVLTFCFKRALENAIRRGLLKLPVKKSENAQKYFMHRWGCPAQPYIDPYKEAMANEINLKNRLTSPQMVLSESGDVKIEEVVSQWEEFIKLCGEKNINPPTFDSANKPIEKDDEDEK